MKSKEAKKGKKRAAPAQALPDGAPPLKTQFLIVDDHSFVRGIVHQHLKSCGFERFAYAENGQEAIEMLKQISPQRGSDAIPDMINARSDAAGDLFLAKAALNSTHVYCVITDFGMPVANGLQLTKAIRSGETGIPRDTPIILLTGFAEDYIVAAALALDVNAFVLKPVSRNALWEKVERVLKSEVLVKEAEIYAALDIPDEDGDIIGAKRKGPQRQNEVEENKDVRRIELSAVQPGAELAEDIHGEHGNLILRQGTVFSEGMLNKLKDLERMRGFSGKIPIRNDA